MRPVTPDTPTVVRPEAPAAPKSVLARGLALLDAFGPEDAELTLTEIAQRAGLPKPTALRLLGQLVQWGALERVGHTYRLGMKMFLLGQRVPQHRPLREAALPYLEDLYEATHENIHLAVPDGVNTLFLEKVTGHDSMPIVSRVGGRLPAHCTATGKIFLAHGEAAQFQQTVTAGLARCTPRTIVAPGLLRRELERTAERGYSVNHEEVEIGVSAVAAPITDPSGRVVAAISVTGRSVGMDVARLAPAVRTAARGLTRELGRMVS
jgi:DNA-binding IclR family transcriptional regulator